MKNRRNRNADTAVCGPFSDCENVSRTSLSKCKKHRCISERKLEENNGSIFERHLMVCSVSCHTAVEPGKQAVGVPGSAPPTGTSEVVYIAWEVLLP